MDIKGIYKKLLILSTAPVLLFGIIITCVSYSRFKDTIYDEARNSMRNIAGSLSIAYDISYEGDYSLEKGETDKYEFYKGSSLITDDYSIIDSFSKKTNTQISLLYMDMRVHTTFITDSGKRLAGLFSNAHTADLVLNNGEEAFYDGVPILDKEYLVLYVPLKNSDNSVIGMIEVAKETASLKKNVWKSVWPLLALAIPGMGIAAYLSFKSTKKITDTLKAIQNFITKVSSGNLQAELDTRHLRRDDELGDIARSSVLMQKSIRASVETDTLTGLPNRRYLFSAFSRITDKAADTGQPFSLAICDIDFFKKVNDTYGHNAGDEVLKAVASKMKFKIQGNGFASRWGGEEFILVFDKCDVNEASLVLNSLLEDIRNMTVETDSGNISVTMTFGLVAGSSNDIDLLIEEADEKLYYGKQHGRNQVVL